MSLNDFLSLTTRGTFVLIAVLTLVDFLRHRDRARLDIALAFGALAAIIAIQGITGITGLQAPWLSTIGALMLLAHPYLLLRLAQHFRPVRRAIVGVALGGMVASWAILIAVPTPLPAAHTLLVVAYFAYVEGYAALAFIRGALSARGVTRWRLSLAASGSGLLAAVILSAGISAALPPLESLVDPLAQILSVLAALSYYVGFAPPRWLRRAWQLSELYRFLREAGGRPAGEQAEETLERLCLAATRAVGGIAAGVALWDDHEKRLTVQRSPGMPSQSSPLALDSGAIGHAWRERVPRAAHSPAEFGAEDPRLAAAVGAGALLAVPIANQERAWGLLLVFLRRSPLFASDDLDLLALFTEQSAIALGYTTLLDERKQAEERLRRAHDELEERVRERTTELAKANEALRESEASFRLLFANNPLPMWVYDLETLAFLEVNDTAVERYGYSREEFLKMRITDIRPPEDVPRLLEEIGGDRPALQHTTGWRHRLKDGTVIDVEITSHRLEFQDRKAALVVAQDVTERKQVEEALRTSESQLSLVYRHVSDVVFYLAVEPDERFRFLSVNPAFLKATGLAESQVVGKLVQEVIPEPAHSLVLSRYREAIRDKKTVHWEEVSVYPTGTKYGEVAVTPIFDANGRCTNLVGTVHDVTESKQAEEEIRRLNAELEQRVIERTAQLEAANKELEAFSYSVSHDLRAPLRSIDGFSQAMLEDYAGKLDPQGRGYLQRMRAASQRMAQLIDDMLELSRITRAELRREKVDLSAMAKAIAADLKKIQPKRQAEFVIADRLVVDGDPRLMRVAMENLLDNAWKFTSKHPRATIEVGAMQQDGRPAYFVRDDGAGFDMAYADKLFGAFQRLHGAAEFEGTGIGLATVQRIIHRHGGHVWAEGAVEKGATFYFNL